MELADILALMKAMSYLIVLGELADILDLMNAISYLIVLVELADILDLMNAMSWPRNWSLFTPSHFSHSFLLGGTAKLQQNFKNYFDLVTQKWLT